METNMSAERCSQCHGPCAVAGSGTDLPALARDDDGRVVCDGCVAVRTRWDLADGRPAIGYVNSDQTAVTSWGGAHVATIDRRATFRSNLTGTTVLAWSGTLPSGARVYGRNGGAHMFTRIHPSRKGKS